MKLLHLALLSGAGLASTLAAPAASADEIGFGVSFGGHRGTRGFVGVSLGTPSHGWYGSSRGGVSVGVGYRSGGTSVGGYYGFGSPGYGRVVYPTRVMPPVVYAPAYEPVAYAPAADPCCQEVWITESTTFREEVVCDPAVYDTRCVPVYDVVCVPIFETRRVPVFKDVCVPLFAERLDARTGRMVRVKVGERTEHVQVGMRDERVKVGERKQTVQVGTRDERVLVRPESKRVVRVPVTLPGRMVTVCDDVAHHHHTGEVMSEAEYRAFVPQTAQAFSVQR